MNDSDRNLKRLLKILRAQNVKAFRSDNISIEFFETPFSELENGTQTNGLRATDKLKDLNLSDPNDMEVLLGGNR